MSLKNIKISRIILLFIILVMIIFLCNFKTYKINGHSMSPTMDNDNIVLAIKINTIRRNDVISFEHNNILMIKRVVGLPGETIVIDSDGTIYINDVVLEEEYIKEKNGISDISYPYKLGSDEYFVLGDNRNDSLDSRNIYIGAINKSNIRGKIIFSLHPFKKIY